MPTVCFVGRRSNPGGNLQQSILLITRRPEGLDLLDEVVILGPDR
jgi:hypothetical protein